MHIPFSDEDRPMAWEISVNEHPLFVDQWCWQCLPVYTDGRQCVAWLAGYGQRSAEEARSTGEQALAARGLLHEAAVVQPFVQ